MASKAEIKQALARNGFHIEFLPDTGLPKVTLYKPNGQAMPNLPADSVSLQSYLARGFTFAPPEHPTDENQNIIKCNICGFSTTNKRALLAHMIEHTSIGG